MGRALFVRLVIAGSVCITVPVPAQTRVPVAVDQRVRVWTDAANAVTGRVTAVTSNVVHVAADGGDETSLAVSTIQRVEISRSRTSRGAGFRKGALRGALILATIGAVSSVVQREQIGDDGATVVEAALLGVWSGGLFGGLIGGAIGAARSGDQWEQVWP